MPQRRILAKRRSEAVEMRRLKSDQVLRLRTIMSIFTCAEDCFPYGNSVLVQVFHSISTIKVDKPTTHESTTPRDLSQKRSRQSTRIHSCSNSRPL